MGHEAVVQLLLAMEKVDIDSKDDLKRTPLMLAAASGHEGIVKQLLEMGANTEVNDRKYGRTPMSWAAVE